MVADSDAGASFIALFRNTSKGKARLCPGVVPSSVPNAGTNIFPKCHNRPDDSVVDLDAEVIAGHGIKSVPIKGRFYY
jgi:hypothetical protein